VLSKNSNHYLFKFKELILNYKKTFKYLLITLFFFFTFFFKKIIDRVTEMNIYFYLIFIIFFWLISFKKISNIVNFLKILILNMFIYILTANFIYLFDFPLNPVDTTVGLASYKGFSIYKNIVTFYFSFLILIFVNLIYFKYYAKK
jgi:hypothetical protein